MIFLHKQTTLQDDILRHSFSAVHFIDAFMALCVSIQMRSMDRLFILEVSERHLEYGPQGLKLKPMMDNEMYSRRMGSGISKQSSYALCSTLIKMLQKNSSQETLKDDLWYAFTSMENIKMLRLDEEMTEAFLHALHDLDIRNYEAIKIRLRKPR